MTKHIVEYTNDSDDFDSDEFSSYDEAIEAAKDRLMNGTYKDAKVYSKTVAATLTRHVSVKETL